MRLEHITESAQIMGLLNKIADMIIEFLPATVRDGDVVHIPLHSYARELDKLYDFVKDDRFVEALKNLPYVTVTIDNKHPSSAKGVYTHTSIHRTADLIVYCKTGANEPDWGKPLYTTNRQKGEGLNIPIKATLVHELRHHFQRFTYGKYYKAMADDNVPYDKNPIEIDAAWFHHLEEFNPADYSSAKEYADALMHSFAAYKKIKAGSPWIRHYYKKTVTYWLDHHHGDTKHMDIKERLALLKKRTISAVIAMMPSETIDLRKIPNYQANSFFIQHDMIRSARAMIGAGGTLSPGNACIIALMMALGNLTDKSVAISYLVKATGLSMADIIASNPFPDKFDTASIDRFLTEIYL